MRLHPPEYHPSVAFCGGVETYPRPSSVAQIQVLLPALTACSDCVVKQRDSLDPLSFAIRIQPIVERIKAEVPGLILNMFDYGTPMGSVDDLATALNITEPDGPAVGTFFIKSLLYISQKDVASASPLPPDIQVTRHD